MNKASHIAVIPGARSATRNPVTLARKSHWIFAFAGTASVFQNAGEYLVNW